MSLSAVWLALPDVRVLLGGPHVGGVQGREGEPLDDGVLLAFVCGCELSWDIDTMAVEPGDCVECPEHADARLCEIIEPV